VGVNLRGYLTADLPKTTAIPIATAYDPAQVERVRDLIAGRACVVVGSAPLSTKTAEIADGELVIAVNGGISSVAGAVDLWVVASRPQDKPGNATIKPLHKTMLHQAKGRTAGHVLMLRGPKAKDASEQHTLAMLETLGCRVGTWSVLDKPTKLHIEKTLCERRDKEPCSSGILATALALYCGAAAVRMVGFSFVAGYQYLPKERPAAWWRNHIPADKRALRALQARYGSVLSGAILDKVPA
jgi:hypothetical protein